MSKVVVFGSMNMDLSVEVSRMPVAGETLAGSDLLTNPGGKGANQAVAASRLGAETHMVAAVGHDVFGEELLRSLQAAAVDCRQVRRLDAVATGTAIILRTDGDNRIVLSPGANVALAPDEVVASLQPLLEPGDVLVTQGECREASTLAAMRLAHERGARVLFNPAPAWDVPAEAWRSVDLVCLNETECQIICGVLPHDEASEREACERLRSMGVCSVVLTLGSAGSAGMDEGGSLVRVPARAFGAVQDTTAAGDTYIGALAAGMTRGLSLENAMRWGSAASGVTVTRLGAQQSIPSAAEVEAALAGDAR